MKILIVEDDAFKFSQIETLVKDVLDKPEIIMFDNVHDTINYLVSNIPDKIILDMSLPSHIAKTGEGSPISMPTGGIEIILELRSIGVLNIPILVITQYPEIEIENEFFSIDESEDEIKDLYSMNNLSVVHYEIDSMDWNYKAAGFLRL